MWFQSVKSEKLKMVSADQALPGRDTAIVEEGLHRVNGNSLFPPYPVRCHILDVGMGCFWGAERLFWQMDGVHVTAVGYAGGFTPNPTYEEVCSGLTGHTEVVRIVYEPEAVSLQTLLRVFWESHDPTQGMRQGNDQGTQYRSALYTQDQSQYEACQESLARYQDQLLAQGYPQVTTEIRQSVPFYYAEAYHQQYLERNPNGYCGLKGTGVACPVG